MPDKLTNLEQLLDVIGDAAKEQERIALGKIMESIGTRSFGPLLLLAGVITFSPISGIPGVPILMGLFVLLIAIQLLIHRKHFWLPDLLLNRSVSKHKFDKALKWLRPPARFIDRFIRPRLRIFTEGAGEYFIAIVCVLIAASMPILQMIPFAPSVGGAALTAFGLSFISRDGIWALVSLILTAIVFAMVFSRLFGL
jgi:hypothetical protein